MYLNVKVDANLAFLKPRNKKCDRLESRELKFSMLKQRSLKVDSAKSKKFPNDGQVSRIYLFGYNVLNDT